MKVVDTPLSGLKIIEPKVFGDERGFFMETYNKSAWSAANLPSLDFVQDNHSKSSKGVLRGLHFQDPGSQGKLVRVIAGAVFDVAVDIRKGSVTFGQYVSLEITAENKKALWIPPGFAHGFLTLEDNTEFIYKCTDLYQPEHEHCLKWDDPAVAIDWPQLDCDYSFSDKDLQGADLSQV